MDALTLIKNRFNVDLSQKIVELPNATRDTLAQIFSTLGFTLGVELGVERGLYSEVLCKANPNLKLFSVDAWSAYEGYRDHIDQNFVDTLMEAAKERLAPYNAVLVKGFSDDPKVLEMFNDNSLDFVYIDASHEFQHVVNDICNWSKKVKVGGIVAGHDYIKRRGANYLMHVPQAIEGFMDAYAQGPLFLLGRKDTPTNTDPNKGELRESTRSWFYVKPAPLAIVPGAKQHS